MTTSAQAKVQAPVSPGFVRDLDTYVEKAMDVSPGDAVANELWSSEFKAFMNAATLKSLFFSEDWVFILVDLIANKIASQPLRIMRAVVDGETESFEPVPEHPLNALLEQPNQWQDYAQWMYNTCVELFLMGNAIIWSAPRSGQLITLPTEAVALDFDAKGGVASYNLYDVSELLGDRELSKAQTFAPKEIIHVRRPNPSSLLWGLSPFIPGRKSILFNRYSMDYLNAFYLKQATPGLALSLDRNVNEDVALRQLRSFELAYQGRKNQRRTLILPKGVKAEALTHTLADQELLEHIKQNRETICALLKVPKHELSLQEAGSLGSEEHKVALRNFWESCLIPGMHFIEGALTKFFQAQLAEEGAFFQFDLTAVEALKDDLKKKAEIAKEMLQAGLSINEVRQQIWQQEPSEASGADDPYVLLSIGARTAPPAGEAPVALPDPADVEAAIDDALASEERGAPEGEKQAAAPAKVKITMTPQLEGLRAAAQKSLVDEESRRLAEMAQHALDLLVGMTEVALDVLALSVKSWPAPRVKADVPDKKKLERRIKRAIDAKYEESWQGQVEKTLTASVEVGYDQQLGVVFNEKDRTAIAALKVRDADKRRASLSARGLDSFENISRTHTDRIMSAITTSVERGEAIGQTMRVVAALLGTPGSLAGKAETIARTETLIAVSIGIAGVLSNAKEVIPELKKAWLTAGDTRVRDSHQGLDGDIVDADAKFDNGLDHPRELGGPAAEVINCRCTLIMIPPGEDLELPQ